VNHALLSASAARSVSRGCQPLKRSCRHRIWKLTADDEEEEDSADGAETDDDDDDVGDANTEDGLDADAEKTIEGTKARYDVNRCTASDTPPRRRATVEGGERRPRRRLQQRSILEQLQM
jgi:hypothetical protein